MKGRTEEEKNAPSPRRFQVRRLGMTGRMAILLFMLSVIPMFVTSWLIESGRLPPGGNVYFAAPALLLILLVPLGRLIAHHPINRDLEEINHFCGEVKEGNYLVFFDLGNERDEEDQFIVLLRNLNWMAHSLGRKESEIRERFLCMHDRCDAMELHAGTDPLTGLYNRRYLPRVVGNGMAASLRKRRPVSLLFIDCDKFKQVNDTYGHAKGDEALCRLAHCIRESIREGLDLPFRFGGDEFAVLLPETEGRQAVAVGQRISELFAACRIGAMTLSIGVASSCLDGNNQEGHIGRLLQEADELAYRAKRAGGNRVQAAEEVATATVSGSV